MTVISLDKKRAEQEPHCAGTAMCLACRHEWAAVIPSSARHVWMECPNCHMHRGLYKFHFELDDGVDRWNCFCGNTLFTVTKAGIHCPNCGDYQTFPY